MAHLIRFTDGTTTVNFGTSPNFIVSYPIKELANGEVTVSETIPLVMTDASAMDTTRANLRTLQTLLRQAADFTKYQRGTAVYVILDPATSGTLYRALLRGGAIDIDKEWLGDKWLERRIEFDVTIERGEYHADSETTLPLTNASATNTTSAITLYNHDDAGTNHDNYAAINAASLTGVTDSPLRLAIANATANTTITNIFIGIGTYQDFANFQNVLEGEASTAGGTGTADATCSGGNYMYVNGTIGTGNTIAYRWALTAAQTLACAGRLYHVLARFQTLPAASMYAAPGTTLTSGTTALQPTQSVALSTADYLQYLGAVTIPPGAAGQSASVAAHDLILLMKKTGGSGSAKLDFIAPFPCDCGFVQLKAITGGLTNTDVLNYDSSESAVARVWQTTSGGAKTFNWEVLGSKLFLKPNRAHRIYILWARSDGSSVIADTITLNAYTRPTRLTI